MTIKENGHKAYETLSKYEKLTPDLKWLALGVSVLNVDGGTFAAP